MTDPWLSTTRILLASAVALALALALLPFAGVPTDVRKALWDAVQLTSASVAAFFCYKAARRLQGTPRLGWTLFALAATSWAVGDALWSYDEVVARVTPPIPSLADVGFLAYFALAMGAILVLAYGRGAKPAGPFGTFLDGALILSTLWALAWPAYLANIFENAPDRLTAFMGVVYPAGDLVIGTILVSILLRGANAFRAGFGWLLAASLFIGIADTGYAAGVFTDAYATGDLPDAGWLLGMFFLAVAAARATEERVDLARPRGLIAALPTGAVLVALVGGLALSAWRGHVDVGTTFAWTAATFLALARSALFAREHLGASRELSVTLAQTAEREAVLSETQRVGRIGSWEVDLATGAQKLSPETVRLVHLTNEAIPTLQAGMARLHPDDRPLFDRMIDAAVRTGSSGGEARLPQEDGSTMWLRFELQSRRDDAGPPIRIFGTVQDITERKLAELEQSRLRAELTEAQLIARLGSWSWDARTDTRQWSEETYHLMGRDPSLGPPTRGDLERMHTPEGIALMDACDQKAMRTRETQDVDVEVLRADGQRSIWITLRSSPVKDANGNVVGLRGTVQDITRRKFAEMDAEQRAQLQAGLRDIASLALNEPDLTLLLQRVAQSVAQKLKRDFVDFLEVDASGHTLTLRAAIGFPQALVGVASAPIDASTLAGYTIHQAPQVILASDGDDPRFAPSARLHEHGILSSMTVAIQTRSGAYGVLGVHSRKPRTPDGAEADFIQGVANIVASAVDRNRAENALRKNERLSSLGTLVAGVAHEINNPLMYIHGSVEMIQQSANDLAEGLDVRRAAIASTIRDDADMALRGLDRIGLITKGLRQVARPAGGERTRESLNAIITGILPIARPRMGPNVQVTMDLQSVASAECNANEVSQVVLNLLFNAADAMGSKGGTIRVATRDADGRILVDVTDDGAGIPADKRAHIFTPFFTTKASGTGLGLSVSHAIIAEHGGELTFDSTEGAGTTFHIQLPTAPPSPRAAPQKATP